MPYLTNPTLGPSRRLKGVTHRQFAHDKRVVVGLSLALRRPLGCGATQKVRSGLRPRPGMGLVVAGFRDIEWAYPHIESTRSASRYEHRAGLGAGGRLMDGSSSLPKKAEANRGAQAEPRSVPTRLRHQERLMTCS
jgi:hypothetical protein